MINNEKSFTAIFLNLFKILSTSAKDILQWSAAQIEDYLQSLKEMLRRALVFSALAILLFVIGLFSPSSALVLLSGIIFTLIVIFLLLYSIPLGVIATIAVEKISHLRTYLRVIGVIILTLLGATLFFAIFPWYRNPISILFAIVSLLILSTFASFYAVGGGTKQIRALALIVLIVSIVSVLLPQTTENISEGLSRVDEMFARFMGKEPPLAISNGVEIKLADIGYFQSHGGEQIFSSASARKLFDSQKAGFLDSLVQEYNKNRSGFFAGLYIQRISGYAEDTMILRSATLILDNGKTYPGILLEAEMGMDINKEAISYQNLKKWDPGYYPLQSTISKSVIFRGSPYDSHIAAIEFHFVYETSNIKTRKEFAISFPNIVLDADSSMSKVQTGIVHEIH